MAANAPAQQTNQDGQAAQQGICPVLHLNLGPLHLDLLGLVVDLNNVVLDITANPAGGLLGSLVCALSGLLSSLLGSLLGAITNALTKVFGNLVSGILSRLGLGGATSAVQPAAAAA